jgi:glycosyltransferase involved in cell wall biosynthesis
MRILHLDPDDVDNPLSGGGPVRTLEIYRRLVDRHEITVATPTFPGSTPEKTRDGIRYVRLGRRIGDHGSSHHLTFMFSLPRLVRRSSFDLLVEDFMPPFSAALSPLFTRRPLIASVQWYFAREWAKRFRLPFHLGEKYGIRLYRNFIVLTRSMADRIQREVPAAHCAVIPNGVDDSLLSLPLRCGGSILYLGRIDMVQKGVDLLLSAYARLPEPRPRLVLAGHGHEQSAARALAEGLGVADDIEWFGRFDASQRAALLSACRFVCVPSREETFGMVIAEACAAAKPVILFDQAPMNEVAEGTGAVLVKPFDTFAFANAMQRLIAAPDSEIIRRGEASRRAMTRYCWNTVARQQEEFYLQVADRHEARAVGT